MEKRWSDIATMTQDQIEEERARLLKEMGVLLKKQQRDLTIIAILLGIFFVANVISLLVRHQ